MIRPLIRIGVAMTWLGLVGAFFMFRAAPQAATIAAFLLILMCLVLIAALECGE